MPSIIQGDSGGVSADAEALGLREQDSEETWRPSAALRPAPAPSSFTPVVTACGAHRVPGPEEEGHASVGSPQTGMLTALFAGGETEAWASSWCVVVVVCGLHLVNVSLHPCTSPHSPIYS